jgi:hypothetical protein
MLSMTNGEWIMVGLVTAIVLLATWLRSAPSR